MDLLWTDFLNSEWHDWRGSGLSEDRLDKPEWLPQFLAGWHLTASIPPSSAELQTLKVFRQELRGMAEALAAGDTVSFDDVAALNRIMAKGPVTRSIETADEQKQLQLLPVREDWPQVMAEIAASFANTLIEGEGARVRICENPDCRWVFYDDTRNRSKRFCDDKLCGNLIKVRRFRARNKAETESAKEGKVD